MNHIHYFGNFQLLVASTGFFDQEITTTDKNSVFFRASNFRPIRFQNFSSLDVFFPYVVRHPWSSVNFLEVSRSFSKFDNNDNKTRPGKIPNHFPTILREAINATYARKLATVAKNFPDIGKFFLRKLRFFFSFFSFSFSSDVNF